jgi:hypothetical protein
MNIRDALIHQSPSLMLQRAASDEIAKLDAAVRTLIGVVRQSERDYAQLALFSTDQNFPPVVAPLEAGTCHG